MKQALSSHLALFATLGDMEAGVNQAGKLCADAIRSGRKTMFAGNGGSAADAQHLAAELVGRLVKDRRALAGLALSTDSSALTCIGNDYGFDEVFARQVEGLGQAGDVLVAISTSGNSGNVIKAVESARVADVRTIGFLGRDGGKLKALVDLSLVVEHAETARIQEAHIFIGHVLCQLIERELGLA